MIGLMDGLFPFGKKSKVRESRIESHMPPGVSQDNSGSSGELVSDLSLTGVARYLGRMPVESSVSKYVRVQQGKPVTGVSRYVVNQALAVRERITLSGVTQYLNKIEQEAPPSSSVAKYMARQLIHAMNQPAITTVAKYMKNMEMAEKGSEGLTGVAKYQAEKTKLAQKIEAQKLIEKYIKEEAKMAKARAVKEAKKSAIEHQKKEADTPEITAGTGVGRYMQLQNHIDSKKPPISGVAKYVAKQVVMEASKPAMSGVAKYLSRQHKFSEAGSQKSKVAKYLEAQEQKAEAMPVMTGVSKYLTTRSLLSEKGLKQSGVAKYLVNQAQIDQTLIETKASTSSVQDQAAAETRVSKYINEILAEIPVLETVSTIVEKCLEGEFIPASEAGEEVVAIKDIKSPTKTKVSAKKSRKATGVSKYLDEQVAIEEKKKLEKRTGVEKYLSEMASS